MVSGQFWGFFFFFSFEDFKSYFLNTEKEDTREYAKHNNDPQSTI